MKDETKQKLEDIGRSVIANRLYSRYKRNIDRRILNFVHKNVRTCDNHTLRLGVLQILEIEFRGVTDEMIEQEMSK